MNVVPTEIPDVLLIEPKRFKDERGFFLESFHAERYAALGIRGPFVQDNISHSKIGVLRGLHLQYPKSQGKLITVLRGCVLDVVVDVRIGSPTFARYVAVELSDDNRYQLWMPRGFAHGFLVLSEFADLLYKCDEFYSPADEVVIRWNDPTIGINWGIESPVLLGRDASASFLADISQLPKHGQI